MLIMRNDIYVLIIAEDQALVERILTIGNCAMDLHAIPCLDRQTASSFIWKTLTKS